MANDEAPPAPKHLHADLSLEGIDSAMSAVEKETLRSLEDLLRIESILVREDGTVVKDRLGIVESARRSGLGIISAHLEEPWNAAPANPSFIKKRLPKHLAEDKEGSALNKVSIIDDSGNSLYAAENGQVTTPKGEGYDCALAMAAKAAVTKPLREGKLDAQTVHELRDFVANAPDPTGKKSKCGPSTAI